MSPRCALVFLFIFLGYAAAANELDAAAADAQWHRLLHYRRTYSGYRSEVEGADFFLSPLGATSPTLELQATLDRFRQGSEHDRQAAQCAFAARRDFLLAQGLLPDRERLPCPQLDEWLSRLSPERAVLVFAAGTFSQPASSFGHVFLKFKSARNDGRDLLNYGVNYSARTGGVTGALYAWYGLLGFFPGNFGLAPYHHLIKEYTNMEGRDLWEYDLNLRRDEIDHLVKHLLELERGHFSYFFLDRNCARLIEVALAVARPGFKPGRGAWALPIDTVKRAVRAGLVTERRFRASLQSEMQSSYRRLRPSERRVLGHFIAQPADAAAGTVAALSDGQIDAAQNYFALEGAYDFRRFAKINYALAVERARRPATAPLAVPAPTRTGPEESAGGSLVALGAAQGPEANVAGTLQLRAFGADLLDANAAGAPFSVFEVLSATGELRSFHQGVRLNEFKLVDVLSTRPVTWIATPLSVGGAIEWRRGWELPLRVGYGFDVGRAGRFMMFATGRLAEVVAGRDPWTFGIEGLWAQHFGGRWRGLVGAKQDVADSHRHGKFIYGLAVDRAPDIQLRVEKSEWWSAGLHVYF